MAFEIGSPPDFLRYSSISGITETGNSTQTISLSNGINLNISPIVTGPLLIVDRIPPLFNKQIIGFVKRTVFV